MCLTVFSISYLSKPIWIKNIPRWRLSPFICSNTSPVGARIRKTRMTRKAASMLITQETLEDLQTYLNIFLRIAILLSRALGKILMNIKICRWDKCERGLKCNKCHTTVERLYHPDKYKRIFCDVCYFHFINLEVQMQQVWDLCILPLSKGKAAGRKGTEELQETILP